jgi:hypothetical protein
MMNSMLRDIDNYFLEKEEPVKSCLLFLRDHIINFDENITEAWKYRMPFYCFKSKMFCYLWVHEKKGLPYLGIVEGRRIDHPLLIQESRARMKIMFIDPEKDIPVDVIDEILTTAMSFYK